MATNLITLEQHGRHARVAAQPASLGEYRSYLHGTGQPVPRPLAQVTSAAAPAVYVSQTEAVAYCQWLGGREGLAYRLPSVAELLELAGLAEADGVGEEMWPHTHSDRPEIKGSRGAIYLCEWTCESQTIPSYGQNVPAVLGSVFYPPWLRQGNNPTQIQGMMQAGQGYSFVSFRVACDL